MSSASQIAGPVPATAPFGADQILQLNAALSGSTNTQRAWLTGFLAGLDAAQAASGTGVAAIAPVAPVAVRQKLTILFGTESGNSEALAADARKAATRLGFAASVLDMADATPAGLAKAENLIVIASTWGEGEPPQRATDFYNALLAPDAPRLDGVRFAVLALGDRAYAQFCAVGNTIDARLAALGAERVAPVAECDLDYAAPAAAWIGTTLDAYSPRADATVIALDAHRVLPAASPDRHTPFAAEITDHVNLHSSRSTALTTHIELSLAGSGIVYEPGDALAVLPRNDPDVVAALLETVGLGSDESLAEILVDQKDVTTLTGLMLSGYAELTGDIALQAIARDKAQAASFMAGRQAIDLFRAAPERLGRDQLLGLLRPLPPRSYSIASSMKAVGEQADLLVALLGWQGKDGPREGVTSSDLVRRRKRGDHVRVWLKPNTHFRLPSDPARPIIMIGPGTGVAPFRGFLQDRRETGAKGRNWLFFGHRQFTHDFLYQLEWQDALNDGLLTRVDLAFSRDQPEKIYVQHRLWQRRDELLGWLDDGASLYVCGDKAMGADIDATLLRILEGAGRDPAATLAALKREQRYLKDVY